jgi:hypothetical protein
MDEPAAIAIGHNKPIFSIVAHEKTGQGRLLAALPVRPAQGDQKVFIKCGKSGNFSFFIQKVEKL